MTRSKRTWFATQIPKCTSREHYQWWKELARKIPPDKNIGFCEDCTSKYKTEMISKGRCENPDIIFVYDEHQNLVGRLPWLLYNKEIGHECI